jgi:large subunit ribosomal protein L6
MSRIGKKAISVPSGVNVSINGRAVTIAKGDKSLTFEHRPEVKVNWAEDEKSITVEPAGDGLENVRAYWGLTRAVLQNMVVGVTEGYEKKLEVVGVGYNAEVAGRDLKLKVGFANTIVMPIPDGIEVTADAKSGAVSVKGIDKQLVGNFAASVRAKRKPEPYNGKGIKYADEVVRRKQGKAFG